MRENKVVIRKYENRRLYDSTHSRYVNLDEIAQMVREGAEVQVVDARSGADLTRLVLTQIIVENAKDRESGLPLDLLQQLVIASGGAGQEGMVRYLRTVFDSYRNAYDAFQTRLQQALPIPLAPFEYMQSFFGPSGIPGFADPHPAAAPEPPAADGAKASPEEELNELRRRVEELERRLEQERGRTARRSVESK